VVRTQQQPNNHQTTTKQPPNNHPGSYLALFAAWHRHLLLLAFFTRHGVFAIAVGGCHAVKASVAGARFVNPSLHAFALHEKGIHDTGQAGSVVLEGSFDAGAVLGRRRPTVPCGAFGGAFHAMKRFGQFTVVPRLARAGIVCRAHYVLARGLYKGEAGMNGAFHAFMAVVKSTRTTDAVVIVACVEKGKERRKGEKERREGDERRK